MENSITYKDYEIGQVQEELKSIKNVKKLQERGILLSKCVVIVSDLENEDLKEKLDQYQKEFKANKDKIKEIDRKARKREIEYKKQQAYLVNLEKKLRQTNDPNFKEESSAPIQPPTQ